MKITLPTIQDQQKFIFEAATQEGIEQLKRNLLAPTITDLGLDESQYSNEHLLSENRWNPPHIDIINAYIEQFKRHSKHNSDKAVAEFLGLKGVNGERRVRAYKSGREQPPFGIWRRLLVATGRVPQEIIPVVAFMK